MSTRKAQPKNWKNSVSEESAVGTGGELHQQAGGTHPPMTTQHGTIISDDENSLKAGPRGPVLMEDHVLLEKTQLWVVPQEFDNGREVADRRGGCVAFPVANGGLVDADLLRNLYLEEIPV